MQGITQQSVQMADTSATDEFFLTCQFGQGFPLSYRRNHVAGVAHPENSPVALSRHGSSDSMLQGREITDCLGLSGYRDSSKSEDTLTRSSEPEQQPQRNANQRHLSNEHPQIWNDHQEQRVSPPGPLHARLTEKSAITSESRLELRSSQASRVELAPAPHLDVSRHRRNEGERRELNKRVHPTLLSRSLHRQTSSNRKYVSGFPELEKATVPQRPFDAESPAIPTENLRVTAQKRTSLIKESSPPLRHKAVERMSTVEEKKQHRVPTTSGRGKTGPPLTYYEEAARDLPASLQHVRPRIQSKEPLRAQVPLLKLQEQRESHGGAEAVFPGRQIPWFRLTGTGGSPEFKKSALRQRRRLHQTSEKRNRGGFENQRGGIFPRQPFADPSTKSLHQFVNNSTATELSDAPPFLVASSSSKQLSAPITSDATAYVSAEHPASATKQASLPSKKLQAEKSIFRLPLAPVAADTQPLSLKTGHLLHARPPGEQTVQSGFIPERAAEHADAFYFTAAAIGCSALLCVAGLVLLLAIFRSYRLRQQKHEVAKQLIRKIHCSGELPTRELVVQYSRELRGQTQQCKDERRQKRGQAAWRTCPNKHSTGRTPQVPTIVLHPRHQQQGDTQNTMVNIKADAPTGKTGHNGANTEESTTLHNKGSKRSYRLDEVLAAEDRSGHASQIFEGESEVLKSGQTMGEMSNERGAARDAHSFVQLPRQQRNGELEAHSVSKTSNSFFYHSRGKGTPSSSIIRQVTGTAAEKRNPTRVPAKECPQNSFLSVTDGAQVVSTGQQVESPRDVRNGAFPRLHIDTYRKQVPPQQQRKREYGGPEGDPPRLQPETHVELRCGSKQKQRHLKEMADCRVNGVGGGSLEKRSHAAADCSNSLFHRAFSISHHLRRALFMTKKEQQTVCATEDQLSSPPLCQAAQKARQRAISYSADLPLSSFPVPGRVLGCPSHKADDGNPVSEDAASACRPARLLHPTVGASSGSTKSNNSRKSGSSGSTTTGSTDISDDRNRREFFSCVNIPTCRAYEGHHRDISGKEYSAHRFQQEALSNWFHGEQAGQFPADTGEKITWVSEVSDDLSCCLQTKNPVPHERTSAENASSAAENNSRGKLYPSSRATASEWEDCTNTDIPTHMMTTAVNNEEEGSSEIAMSSNEDVTENEDEAIVEFDSANVSLELEEAVHSRQSPNAF